MSNVTPTPAGISMDIDIDAPTPPSSTTTPAPQAPPPAPATNSFLEMLPEQYRNKERFVNFSKAADPMGELLKSYENQESLIGKKAEGLRVPGEGATAEDWAAFNKALGVPETPDGYEYKVPENIPDELKDMFQPDEKLVGIMKDALARAGVRKGAENIIFEAFDNYYLDALKTQSAANESMFQKLENDFKQKFGERSNVVLENFTKSITSLGEEQANLFNQLHPSLKVLMAEHHENFAKKYVREDGLHLDVPTSSPAMTATQYGDEYEKAFAAVRSAEKAHGRGSSEYVEANQKLQSLRNRGQQIFKP